jgi:hypothetical protein
VFLDMDLRKMIMGRGVFLFTTKRSEHGARG